MSDTRIILHSDMNSFYASVEMLLNPSLRGRAIAVCGDTENRHGIVLAKSESAKRAGVKTGMVNWEARQCCPELLMVPPQYEQYMKYSRLARRIYERYTDFVEPFGMDECWLDVTDSAHGLSGTEIAQRIRRECRSELGLTVSIGVSFNKIFAKLGSDMKKPDAVTEITPQNFRALVWPLDAGEIIYVGPAIRRKLRSFGISTVGELAAADPEFLHQRFGVNGLKLWRYANGTDRSRVMHRDFVSPIKSIGHGVTCTADLETEEAVRLVMLSLAQDVGHRLRVSGLCAHAVDIGIRGADLSGREYHCRLPFYTQLPSELARAGFELFRRRRAQQGPVRAVCIRAAELAPQKTEEQESLFVDRAYLTRRARLEDSVEEIRGRFGKRSLTYAALLGDLKIPEDGRDIVRMPAPMYQ